MAKKVKSFALEQEPYESISLKFKENYVDVTISYCFNKYIKELLEYLEVVEKAIKESGRPIPMAFVIETVTRGPIFKVLEQEPRPGEAESSLQTELDELQKKYDVHIKRNPAAAIDFAKAKLEDSFLPQMLTFVGKGLLLQIKKRRELTDEEWQDLVRKEGGKELQKYLREVAVPVLDRIDPDIREVISKVKKIFTRKTSKTE